jgi:hypothetical protein
VRYRHNALAGTGGLEAKDGDEWTGRASGSFPRLRNASSVGPRRGKSSGGSTCSHGLAWTPLAGGNTSSSSERNSANSRRASKVEYEQTYAVYHLKMGLMRCSELLDAIRLRVLRCDLTTEVADELEVEVKTIMHHDIKAFLYFVQDRGFEVPYESGRCAADVIFDRPELMNIWLGQLSSIMKGGK